jgi:hypothetical protein
VRAWMIGLLLLLGACSQQAWIERLSTQQERDLAMQMAVAVRDGDTSALWNKSINGLQSSLNRETIARMHSLAPAGTPKLESVIVTSELGGDTPITAKTFIYEIGAGQRWALIRITLFEGIGAPALAGAYVQPFEGSPVAANRLTLKGKGAINYLWVAAMALALATSLAAFVLILGTPGLKLKWLWAIGSLFSFVTFGLNWTTGAWGIQPISFLLLGAGGFHSGSLTPWVINFAIPVVAIVFLVLRGMNRLPLRSLVGDQPETGTP